MFIDNKIARATSNFKKELNRNSLEKAQDSTFFHRQESGDNRFALIDFIKGTYYQESEPSPENYQEVKFFDGEIVSCGRNLINIKKLCEQNTSANLLENADRALRYYGEWNLLYKIFIKAGTTIRLSWTSLTQPEIRISYGVFYADGTREYKRKGDKVTLAKDLRELIIEINDGNLREIYLRDICLEVLDDENQSPIYQYFDGVIFPKLTMRAVPSGTRDEIVRREDGSYLSVQRIGAIELDGSEAWSKQTFENKVAFACDEPKYVEFFHTGANNLISTRYPLDFGLNKSASIAINGPTNYYRIYIRDDSIISVEDLKAKLKQWKNENKPLVVYGELMFQIVNTIYLPSIPIRTDAPLSIYQSSYYPALVDFYLESINSTDIAIKMNNLYNNTKRYNKNLLINPNFSINQRYVLRNNDSKEEIIADGETFFSDCWKTNKSSVDNFLSTVQSFKDGGIIFRNKTSQSRLYVLLYMVEIEKLKPLIGKYLTLTVCYNDNTIVSNTYFFDGHTRVIYYTDGNFKTHYRENFDIGFIEVGCPIGQFSSFKFNWIKLEEGKQFTGYISPNYEEELIKCQYFYKKLYINETLTVVDNHNTCIIPINNDITMRKNPTMSFLETGNYFIPSDGSEPINIDDATFSISANASTSYLVLHSSKLPKNKTGVIAHSNLAGNYVTNLSYIILNAEL